MFRKIKLNETKLKKPHNPRIWLILPTKNPTKETLKIIEYFYCKMNVLVIDDGSTINIELLKNIKNKILLITNKKNMGKGFSIKKALKTILNKKKVVGAIIADSDGQHSINDIQKIYNLFSKNPEKFILGQRKFKILNTPLRNYFGNFITSLIFLLKFKIYIDTQCGLRAMPIKYMNKAIVLNGNDYSFEMKQLIEIISINKNDLKFINIKTIYKKNIKSYFNPILDSISIFKKLLK